MWVEEMDIEWTMERERMDGATAEELKDDIVEDADANLFNVFTDGTPQTPDSSIFISDAPNPLSSETDLCANESDSSPSDVENIELKGMMLKRKAPAVGGSVRSPRMLTKRQRVCEVGEGPDEEDSGRESDVPSRSALATRKLRELMKSGKLVVDEQKKAAMRKNARKWTRRRGFATRRGGRSCTRNVAGGLRCRNCITPPSLNSMLGVARQRVKTG